MSQLDITRRFASPRMEEEDLPVDADLPVAGGAPTDFDDYAPPPSAPTVPQEPQGAAPEAEPSDLLQRYFKNQAKMQERLSRAEDTASQNRFIANMGGAFSRLAQASSTHAPDTSAFDQMAKQADAPVERVERQQKLDQGGDKMLLNYFLNKNRADSLDAWRNGKLAQTDRSLGLRDKSIEERGRHNREIEGAVKEGIGIRREGLGERKRHNEVTEGIGQQNVGMRREGLDTKKGAQAAQAADKFTKDPVIKTSSVQLSQIDKAMGRLDDVESGKIPFSTTLKAEIEKDIANIISGGTSSSLGQLHRVEFEPYVAKWQAVLDKVHGYQGDINAPEFRQQIRAQLSGLAEDLAKIRGKRSKDLQAGYGTAYSKNDVATKTIEDNVKLYGGDKPAAPPAPKPLAAGEVARKTVDGRTAIYNAQTKKFLRYQE